MKQTLFLKRFIYSFITIIFLRCETRSGKYLEREGERGRVRAIEGKRGGVRGREGRERGGDRESESDREREGE